MKEFELYTGVRDFLEMRFRDRLRPTLGEIHALTAITANTPGEPGAGVWSRPDLALVALIRNKFDPSWRAELHGFEVKIEKNCNVSSVHEALSHTSYVRYTHLVWQMLNWNDSNLKCQKILEKCLSFGVGLITFNDLANSDSFVVRAPSARHTPLPDAVDEFIETRFGSAEKIKLTGWINRTR